MNTPAHMIFGATAFGRAGAPAVTAAAVAGSLAPDLSLYLLAGWHLFILGTPPEVVFGELYFSDEWVRVFRIDNSAVLWGLALVLAIRAKSDLGVAFTGAALLHIAFDLPVHAGDGRPHFWPISNWIFDSPVSYWDSTHYGGIVGPLEVATVLACCVVLWRRHPGLAPRALIGAAAALQVAPFILWSLIF